MAQAKGDRTRAQIIEGAARALAEHGVIGATTRKIAAEAGVELATLHYHFDNKSAILLAVLESIVGGMASLLRRRMKPLSDVDKCIEQMLQAAWQVCMKTRPSQVVQYELTLYALRMGEGWLAERQYDAYLGPYIESLRSVPEERSGLSLEDCEAISRFMLAGMDGILLQELAKPDRSRSKRAVGTLIASTQVYAKALRWGGADKALGNGGVKVASRESEGAASKVGADQ